MATIRLDGHTLTAKEGTSLLEAARTLNIAIPTLCFHQELTAFGACRLCMVEVKVNGRWQLTASCTTPLTDGMEVRTTSERIQQARRFAAELLLSRYPTTEAVRAVARQLGVEAPAEKGEGHDCILCGLCVRTCREIVGVSALSFEDRGLGRGIEEPKIEFNPTACIGCGSCATVCPTGFVQMEAVDNKRIIWDKVFTMVPCRVCGRYFAPADQLHYISTLTGVPFSELTTCTTCR
jgi:bidirectional [NiFe] hydrogenase diaphorase subunit